MIFAVSLSEALIVSMDELCRQNNISFILVNLPIKKQFSAEIEYEELDTLKISRIIQEISLKHKIPLIDLYPIMNASEDPILYYIADEYHLSEQGHKLVADAILSGLAAS